MHPTSENFGYKVQKIIYIFFKTISHLTGHLNISIFCYYLSFFRQEGVGWRRGGGGGGLDNLAWAASSPPPPPPRCEGTLA